MQVVVKNFRPSLVWNSGTKWPTPPAHLTDRLLEEIIDVAPRKRFEKYFKDNDLKDFLKYLKSISSKIKIKSEVSICRDEKDNYLLALAQDSKADYIVTGDKDLLTLETFGKTQIIQFNKFNELFQP